MKERRSIQVQGIVQGVGFRPFVYGLATRAGLSGRVCNTTSGVSIEVEGEPAALDLFTAALDREAPPLAMIQRIDTRLMPSAQPHEPDANFQIAASDPTVGRTTLISPDVASCDACLAEMRDPADRRYRYPFINCTHCGPRFTIVQGVPYDRPQTTMAPFTMCPACHGEYHDPADRRFHAQPNGCPQCGPQLALLVADRLSWATNFDDPLITVQALLAAGHLVALKGLGGYHLACDATQPAAVERLRRVKQRGDKPLAIMVADVATAALVGELSPAAADLLTRRQRPIVVVPRRPEAPIAAAVAPGQNSVGIMLPYTPLHHLLLVDAPCPVLVMTSANRGGDPIIFTDEAAFELLGEMADAVLWHDRAIHMRCDDAVGRVVDGRPQLLRRSRGFAPQPLILGFKSERPLLALGGHLKNSFCLVQENQAFVSHHIGDLDSVAAIAALEKAVAHYQRLFAVVPVVIAHDLHPDYHTTRLAENWPAVKTIGVQHHHAHIASVLAEHRLSGPVIGVAFDGSGMGPDGTIWGGEFMVADLGDFTRVGRLRHVPLPGGEQAVREPWRVAAAWLRELYGKEWPLSPAEMGWNEQMVARWAVVEQMIERHVNCPLTSSMGRLFDAVAALIGLRQVVTYEGQAAIELEAIADPTVNEAYSFKILDEVFDPGPMIAAVATDMAAEVPQAVIAAKFHNGVAEIVAAMCTRVKEATGLEKVALSGGVWQNRLLLIRTVELLKGAGFEAIFNEQVPPNDGGLALGQAAVAAAHFKLLTFDF